MSVERRLCKLKLVSARKKRKHIVLVSVKTEFLCRLHASLSNKQGRHRWQTPPPLLPLGSYFKRPKSSAVRTLTCNWYYCAEFIAKLKAARAGRRRRATLAYEQI